MLPKKRNLVVVGSGRRDYRVGVNEIVSHIKLELGLIGFEPRVVGAPVWIDNLTVTSIEDFSYDGSPTSEPSLIHLRRATPSSTSGQQTSCASTPTQPTASMP